ncbi:MAG TPA: DEAD/DEAH box helicase, partial [Planctomycetota bacterium]|nr:DEAD/DEAH box helicase [Planctomycetota bacterium]
AVEDFQIDAGGTVHVRVLDPRDSRKFLVTVQKDSGGKVRAHCTCPYRMAGCCRHQVVSLQYLLSVSEGNAVPILLQAPAAPASLPVGGAPAGGSGAPARESAGPVLWRLYAGGGKVSTRPDGSLLRIVLHSLGSLEKLHVIGLQLFTGTGWTEVRSPDVDRWIARDTGAHPRDARIAALLKTEGAILREVDSEVLAALLEVLAGSDALVDRSGRVLEASRWPWRLAARLVRGKSRGVGVEFSCRAGEGETLPFDEVSMVPSVAPWIQLETGAFHPLIAGAPGPILAELQGEDHSEIQGEDLDRLLSRGAADLERLCPGAFETEPGLIEEVEGVTRARLRLAGTPARLGGRLELAYGTDWVDAPETPEPWSVNRDGTIHRFPPAGQSLARAARELEAIGFRREEGSWVIDRPGALAAILAPRPRAFVALELPPALEALDFVGRAPILRLDVMAPGAAGRRAGGGAPAGGSAQAGRGRSGIAWLEVSVQLLDGARKLPIDLPELKKALAEGSRGPLQLPDGTVLGLQHESLRSLQDLLAAASPNSGDAAAPSGGEQGGESPSRLRIPITSIGALSEEEPGREVCFGLELSALVDGLRGGGGPPEGLRGEVEAILRPYQREAAAWFGRLGSWGLAGVLADEMGLGKTVMALAHFFGRPGSAPAGSSTVGEGTVLVVCPSSLVFNWLDECHRFFPGVRCVGLYGLPPAAREEAIRKGTDLLVTSYALLRRDREALEAQDLRAVVLDEAQHVKNAESQTAQAAFALRSGERWVLTGTPVENRLEELWSLFQFLMPGFLGTASDFKRTYAEPISRREGDVLEKLRTRVRPFLLRRTKAQVLTELPPRIDQVERVAMTELQAAIYQRCLLEARSELGEETGAASRFRVLTALTRLRQICCHPQLILDEAALVALGHDPRDVTSGKFELVLELLDECIEEGHRVLLYSQFTSMLDIIEKRLVEKDIPRSRLDGSTRDREVVVRQFQRDTSIPVFLISLKAGGFGLNLTEADTVILYDPWWNPAAEEQAAARVHRMGQKLPVHIHKLITAGTVEEKILDLQASKRDLAESVVRSEEEALEALSFEDLRGLLLGHE